MRLAAFAAALAGGCLASGTAWACTVGNPPAATAEERIGERSDLRRVTGTFRIDDLDLSDSVGTQRVRGRITTKRGTTIDVAYSYHQTWMDCLIYYLPRADAEGRFYISRRMRDGRYELVDWSGDYVAGKVIGIQDED